ncbi:MAG: hypothetical protein R3F02_02735 [Thiolinea sp.]
MKKTVLKTLLSIGTVTLLTITPLQATELDYSCTVNLRVKDRAFDFSPYGYPMTISCPLVESRREVLFDEYEAIKDKSFEELEKQISQLDSDIDEARNSRNWKAFRTIGSKVIVYTGIAGMAVTCATGVGCAIGGAVSILWGAIDTIEGVAGITEKQNAIDLLSRKLNEAKRQLRENKSNLETAKNNLAAEFNELCDIVKKECL